MDIIFGDKLKNVGEGGHSTGRVDKKVADQASSY